MTTTETIEPAPVDHRPVAATAQVSPWRVIVAEWIKFVSLRSNLIALAGAVVAVIGFGALTAGVASGAIEPDNPMDIEQPDFSSFLDHTAIATSGVMLAILIVGTLGVLAMSGEYSSGMIRATAAAVPRRLQFLFAKIVVLVAVTAVTMTVAVFVAFAVSRGILDAELTSGLGDPGVLRALLGNVGYMVGLALLGLALGVLLRSSAGGIATLFATFLILPQLITLVLPDRIVEVIYGYLPSNAAASFITTSPEFSFSAMSGGGELLSAAAGAAVFAVWVVTVTGAAAVVLTRRDA